ncbi:MAG: hypothetical protein ACAI25_07940 [Planctomycetota bacterium]
MRRSLALAVLVFASLLAVRAEVRAEDDGFKWNATKRRAPAVGDRYFQVNEDIQSIKSKIVRGKEETDENSFSSLKYRVVHEILGVEKDKITKERVTVERWSVQKEEKEPEDKTLTGKIVVIEGTDKKTVTYENGTEGVSEDAKRWVEVTFARADPMEQIEKLLPKEPVGDGSSWDLDTKELARDIFQGTEIDPQKSTAKGSLKNVRVEDGIHLGDIEIKISLQLKQIPNAPIEWKEGGLVDLVVTIQGSLEQEKNRKRAVKMELKLKGRAEHESSEGSINVKMEMKMTTSFTSGDMPKK